LESNTGATTSVPRHPEVQEFLARKICRDLGIKLIERKEWHVSLICLRFRKAGEVLFISAQVFWQTLGAPNQARLTKKLIR
jgi:hypothetical protein